ncbi:hypothetical protein ACFV8E_37730 [Streptomyces sp. NPDC059849]|uniref:hypothetical protein n=1 Tax=Streptomyces sp. NPDC059849 TaxID=3346969 RepID=UPI0036519E93
MSHTVLAEPAARWALAASTVGTVAAGALWFGGKAPYAQHKLLDLPLPYLTSNRLDAVLPPSPRNPRSAREALTGTRSSARQRTRTPSPHPTRTR